MDHSHEMKAFKLPDLREELSQRIAENATIDQKIVKIAAFLDQLLTKPGKLFIASK